MPIQTGHFYPIGKTSGVRLPHLRSRSPQVRIHNNATQNMQPVQTGHRKVNGKIGVGAGKSSFHKLMRIFKILDHKKCECAKDRESHVHFVF